jgi:hypothetical protein
MDAFAPLQAGAPKRQAQPPQRLLAALAGAAGVPVRALAIRIDRVRAKILAAMLRVALFDRIFRSRTKRLAAVFSLSLAAALSLALTFPLWVLLIGPLVLGIPHLVASLSFVPRLTTLKGEGLGGSKAAQIGAFFVAVAATRLWGGMPGPWIIESFPNAAEMAAGLFAAGWLAWMSSAGLARSAASAAILSALAATSMAAPAETLGGLVLAHNFVGFLYWIARAPEPEDRRLAFAALTLFALATAAILAGAFDAVIQGRALNIAAGALSDWDIGQAIFPGTEREIYWSRAVSAFALGQSLHYFVWLRAIPEQELPHGHPIGFSKSLRLLERDIGPLVLYGAAYGLAGLFAYAFLGGWPEARLLYLTAAAFHGYFEIAGLAFVRRALPASVR